MNKELAKENILLEKSNFLKKGLFTPVFFIMLVFVSIFISIYIQDKTRQALQTEFLIETDEIVESVTDRKDIYITALEGGRGLFNASESVSRSNWAKYVTSINIGVNYPGIQGLGYSVFVNPEEKESHIRSIRAEGFPEYYIRPDGIRDMYTSIIYLEPFDERNRQAFGFDMYSNTVRRTAMDQARDTGKTWASGVVTLVQEIDEDIQPGFLMYVPFYGKESSLETVEDRRNNIVGYVYSPFRAEDFINQATKEYQFSGVEFRITDTSDGVSSDELYNSVGKDFDVQLANAVFSKTKELDFAGRVWTFTFFATDDFPGIQSIQNQFIMNLAIGVIFSILVTFIIHTSSMSRKKAIDYADKVTKDLQESNQSLVKAKEEAVDKAEEANKLNMIMVERELAMIKMKEELQVLRRDKGTKL